MDAINNSGLQISNLLTNAEIMYESNRRKFQEFFESLVKNCRCSLVVSSIENFRLYIKLIKLGVDKEEIYNNKECMLEILDFTLLNIESTKNLDQEERFTELFQLLTEMISRVTTLNPNWLDKDRIIEILHGSLNHHPSNDIAVRSGLLILQDIVELVGPLPNNVSGLILKIFEQLKTFEYISDMCTLIKVVLNKFQALPKNTYSVIEWFSEESYLYIQKFQGEDNAIVTKILNLVPEIEKKLKRLKPTDEKCSIIREYYFNTLKRFLKISDVIWKLCHEDDSKEISILVLTIMLRTFFNQEGINEMANHRIINNELNVLIKMKEEDYGESRYFLFICHMQQLHNRLIWNPKIIMDCMYQWIYTKRDAIDTALLKTILYLYPSLLGYVIGYASVAMSCDLLEIFSSYATLPSIYSYYTSQLVWVLQKGNKHLKLEALRHWITENYNMDKLIMIIKECKAGNFLMTLIMEDYGEKTGKRAAELLSKIDDEHISREIAFTLPLVVYKPMIFNYLIISNPGIPEEIDGLITLCSLMSAYIPSIDDRLVLKGSCIYSNSLLKKLHRQPESFLEFGKHKRTIGFLVSSVPDVDDDIGIEILRLLTSLISIQMKHNIEIKDNRKEDLSSLLQGSPTKINWSLYLIRLILVSKIKLIVDLAEALTLVLYGDLFELCTNPELASEGYYCLQLMLMKNEWLASSSATAVYMKMQCTLHVTPSISKMFINCLNKWLNIVLHSKTMVPRLLPVSHIQSFILRSEDRKKIVYFSRLLYKITKKMHIDK